MVSELETEYDYILYHITNPIVLPKDTDSSWWLCPQSLPRTPLKSVLCFVWQRTKLKCGYFFLNSPIIWPVHLLRIYEDGMVNLEFVNRIF